MHYRFVEQKEVKEAGGRCFVRDLRSKESLFPHVFRLQGRQGGPQGGQGEDRREGLQVSLLL